MVAGNLRRPRPCEERETNPPRALPPAASDHRSTRAEAHEEPDADDHERNQHHNVTNGDHANLLRLCRETERNRRRYPPSPAYFRVSSPRRATECMWVRACPGFHTQPTTDCGPNLRDFTVYWCMMKEENTEGRLSLRALPATRELVEPLRLLALHLDEPDGKRPIRARRTRVDAIFGGEDRGSQFIPACGVVSR